MLEQSEINKPVKESEKDCTYGQEYHNEWDFNGFGRFCRFNLLAVSINIIDFN